MRRYKISGAILAFIVGAASPIPTARAQSLAGRAYSVVEISFHGPPLGPADAPARDIEFWATIRHHSGAPAYKVYGFWDGDGNGGDRGGVFKIRFCPTRPGRWDIVEVHSNDKTLNHQHEGEHIDAAPPGRLHGFWMPDPETAGRWYKRSDGTHPYIFGNTMYSFLSQTSWTGRPNGSGVARDIRENARYFRKLRFSAIGDRYPDPALAPFLDDAGRETQDGNYSFRPNPRWFHDRVDVAVRTAFDSDFITDLILSGVDLETSRSSLRPSHNGGDATPYLRYMAARYGSFPNVWMCLINEYDIRVPKYTPDDIKRLGAALRSMLPYSTPISVHRSGGPWLPQLNPPPQWNDHEIIQRKLRMLAAAADALRAAYEAGGSDKPAVDDELSYQGSGDRHSEADTVEAHLGAFLGGGYGTTGYKSGGPSRRPGMSRAIKTGQYFCGNFNVSEHTAAAKLAWGRSVIDRIPFWRLRPADLATSVFSGALPQFRAMEWKDNLYVLGTDASCPSIVAHLPKGRWRVQRFDWLAEKKEILARSASGDFTFAAPDSRAVLFLFERSK